MFDLEECARTGERPPPGGRYRIRINRAHFVVDVPTMTGAEILALAGKSAETHDLHQIRHGVAEPIGPEKIVDFTAPGVERFRAVQTEVQAGGAPRRHFRLPPADEAFLESLGVPWETVRETGAMWLLVHQYDLPAGLSPRIVTIALEIPAAYPDTALDMFWASPHISRIDGSTIPATNSQRRLDGKMFQRWSRHRTPANPWRLGEDGVASQFAIVAAALRRERRVAA